MRRQSMLVRKKANIAEQRSRSRCDRCWCKTYQEWSLYRGLDGNKYTLMLLSLIEISKEFAPKKYDFSTTLSPCGPYQLAYPEDVLISVLPGKEWDYVVSRCGFVWVCGIHFATSLFKPLDEILEWWLESNSGRLNSKCPEGWFCLFCGCCRRWITRHSQCTCEFCRRICRNGSGVIAIEEGWIWWKRRKW